MSLYRSKVVNINSSENVVNAYSRGINFDKLPGTDYVLAMMRERACVMTYEHAKAYSREIIDYLREEFHDKALDWGIKDYVILDIIGPFPENVPQRSKFLC